MTVTLDKTQQQQRRLEEVVDAVCTAHGLRLVDARFVTQRGAVLKVLIERPGESDGGSGVTLSDCQAVSRDLSTALDVEDDAVPNGAYRLEVSSPGLERPLLRAADYVRFEGREAKVTTKAPIDGRRNFTGVLSGTSGEGEGISVRMQVEGNELEIPFAMITKAHLLFKLRA